MKINDITINSDLEEVYTNLLAQKTEKYLNSIKSNKSTYFNFLRSISFISAKNGENFKGNYEGRHFINNTFFNSRTKEIEIYVDKRLPLVYEGLFYGIQRGKNNGVDQRTSVLRDKHPFIYNIIDEYIAYSKAMEYLMNTEYANNKELQEWYRKYLSTNNKNYENSINESIEFLNNVLGRNSYYDNEFLVNGKKYCHMYSLPYMLAKINVLKLNDYDSRLNSLLYALNEIKEEITENNCRNIREIFLDINKGESDNIQKIYVSRSDRYKRK